MLYGQEWEQVLYRKRVWSRCRNLTDYRRAMLATLAEKMRQYDRRVATSEESAAA